MTHHTQTSLAVLMVLGGATAVFSADPQRPASLRSDSTAVLACKPAGRKCRTNESCCSGLCVLPTGRHGNGAGICCAPTTCSAAGANCGTLADGCGGTLDCGPCTDPETCGGGGTANVCGCTPATCADLGADCGTLADGCGGTLDCGTCTDPETCGGSGTANVCGVPSCTPGTVGCGWESGEVITYTQNQWGEAATAAGALLAAHFNTVYFGAGGVLEVGVVGSAGTSMIFTSAAAILAYQPAIGPVGALNADLVDPTTTSSGSFGGHVVALKLNIDFADAGHMDGTTGLHIANLTICATPVPAVNGITVRTFAGYANSALGGGPAPTTISILNDVANSINAAFIGGNPSGFAQASLFNGACP